jgi:hypothetical protein
MMNDDQVNDRIHTELLELHRMAVNDIAFFKQQQWRVTNYSLLLYGAIVATPKLIGNVLSRIEYSALLVASLAVLIAGILLLQDLEKSLEKGRNRLPAVRKYFDREITLRAYAAGGDPEKALITSKERSSLAPFFTFVLILGFLFTTWILIRLMCHG